MLTRLIEYTQEPHHRLRLWVSLWMVFSWILILPNLRFGLVLRSFDQVIDIQNLIAVKDLNIVTKLIANMLDMKDAIKAILYSLSLLDVGTFILEFILCSKTTLKPRLAWFARIQLISGFLLNLGLLAAFALALNSTQPNTALWILTTMGSVTIMITMTRIILPFAAWVDLVFFS